MRYIKFESISIGEKKQVLINMLLRSSFHSKATDIIFEAVSFCSLVIVCLNGVFTIWCCSSSWCIENSGGGHSARTASLVLRFDNQTWIYYEHSNKPFDYYVFFPIFFYASEKCPLIYLMNPLIVWAGARADLVSSGRKRDTNCVKAETICWMRRN